MVEEKKREIDSILKNLYMGVSKQLGGVNANAVYHYLIRRAVPIRDLNKNIGLSQENFFDKWIEKFRKQKHIQVFVQSDWQYFCQFTNENRMEQNPGECLKMYIPLDYDHIYEGVNRIFDFLEKNNIKHHSKVSAGIRFDDVVVRLYSKEDAPKLQEFIARDRYIQEGLIKNNPFAFEMNGISYAYDNRSSYNFCVASVIAGYINDMQKMRVDLADVNMNSFYNYVDHLSQDFGKMRSFIDEGSDDSLIDAYYIVNILKKSMASNDMRDFFAIYDEACREGSRKRIGNLIYDREQEDTFKQSFFEEDLFQEFILTTMKKYPLGSDESHPSISGFNYIYSYLHGNDRAVTRDHNLRERVQRDLKKEDIVEIVERSNLPGQNLEEKLGNYVKKVMLDDVIRNMNVRFPDGSAGSRIRKFLTTGDSHYITNKVGQARNLVKTMRPPVIQKFFQDLGVMGIEDYI